MEYLRKQQEKIKYIYLYHKFLNVKLFNTIITIIAVIMAYMYRKGGILSSFIYFLSTYIIANFMFDLIVSIYKAKTQRIYTNVISILTGYLSIYSNTIYALKQTAEHIQEPFKSIITKNIYAYEAGNIGEEKLYQNLIKEIPDTNFKELFEILYISSKHGNKCIDILDRMRKNTTQIYNIKRQIEASTKVSTAIVFIMIYINLYLMYQSLKTQEMNYMLNTPQGNMLIILNLVLIIIALFIVRWITNDE